MSDIIDQKLPHVGYMSFPFRILKSGAQDCTRVDHVRQQIEQVLFTAPGERVFRPEFGAGIERMIFEPNSDVLAALLLKRLQTTLQPVIETEVLPESLDIHVSIDPSDAAKIIVTIKYTLAAIDYQDQFTAALGV